MDVHRSRFVPYPASAINALAFSGANLKELGKGGLGNLRLALGRANGDIEIWNPVRGAWVQETIFRGGKDRSVEALAWIQEPDEVDSTGKSLIPGSLRLFSVGYSSTVTEWNLATGLPIRQSSGDHSEVWCLAAQPRWEHNTMLSKALPREGEWRGQNLIVGCADGTLAMLSTGDNDLHFQKIVSRPTGKKARALSITFQDRDIVVAGFADSAIRIFDTRNSTLIRTVTLGAGPKGGPREILVWAVKCLPNGEIVTGDSTGEVRFFEGKNYAQYQRISGHDADILDVTSNDDGSLVFSTGMDRKTTVYNRPSSSKRMWAKAGHKKNHEHDVKALASFEGADLSFMVSGGIDTQLAITPLRDYWQGYPHVMSTLPQLPPVAAASSARLILTWWERELSIWQIKQQNKKGLVERAHKLAARIGVKGDESITSAVISSNGSFLVVSTAAEVRLFQLSRRTSDEESPLRIRKVQLDEPLSGARLLHLSPDGKWLALVSHSNVVNIARIVTDDGTGKVRILPKLIELERLTRTKQEKRPGAGIRLTALEQYSRTVTRLQFAPDSRLIVASDLSGYMDSWILKGQDDPTAPEIEESEVLKMATESDDSDDEDEGESITIMCGQLWSRNPAAELLPVLPTAPILLSFRPLEVTKSKMKVKPKGKGAGRTHGRKPHETTHDTPEGPYHLVVLTATHTMHEFDLLSGKLTDWSKNNPTAHLPTKFTFLKDRAMGCSWHMTSESHRLWIYGSTWLFMFDLLQDFDAPKVDGVFDGVVGVGHGKKRKREDDKVVRARRGVELVGLQKMRKIVDGRIVNTKRRKDGDDDHDDDVDGEEDEHDESADEIEDESVHPSRRLRILGEETEHSNDQGETQTQMQTHTKPTPTPTKWWHTRIYRCILGMLEIAKSADCLEIAIIERPVYELDLPPRLLASYER